MDGLIHAALALGGLAAGWALNAFVLRLSERTTKMFENLLKAKGKDSAKWAGWFVAVAIYLVIAVSGVGIAMKFTVKGIPSGVKSYAGFFLSGLGAGALIDELFQMPSLDNLGAGVK